jgi:CheY-like chemotaxis protein
MGPTSLDTSRIRDKKSIKQGKPYKIDRYFMHLKAAKSIRIQQKHLPILAITANAVHKQTYKKNGVDDILEKPYKPDLLYAKIKELTGKRKKDKF